MGLCCSAPPDDDALPPSLPDGYVLQRSALAVAADEADAKDAEWWDGTNQVEPAPRHPMAWLMDVVAVPPGAPAAGSLIAKPCHHEAYGHALLRNGHRRVASCTPRSPHVITNVALSANMVVLPRFETSLQEACMGKRLVLPDILAICADVVRAVAFLATCGLVHGDIAPANVVLECTPSGVWHGVLMDLQTLSRVRPQAPHWFSKPAGRPQLYAVARHHRYDADRSHVDVVDEMEAVGWTLLWAVCTATHTPFPFHAFPLADLGMGQGYRTILAAAQATGLSWTIHPTEASLMQAKTQLRARLAGRPLPALAATTTTTTTSTATNGGESKYGSCDPSSSSSSPVCATAILWSAEFAPVRAFFATLASLPRRAPRPLLPGEGQGGPDDVWSVLVALQPAEVDRLVRCLTP